MITTSKTHIENLTTQRYRSVDLFEKNELYETYQKLIEERDELIKTLVSKLQLAQSTQIVGSGNASMMTMQPKPTQE